MNKVTAKHKKCKDKKPRLSEKSKNQYKNLEFLAKSDLCSALAIFIINASSCYNRPCTKDIQLIIFHMVHICIYMYHLIYKSYIYDTRNRFDGGNNDDNIQYSRRQRNFEHGFYANLLAVRRSLMDVVPFLSDEMIFTAPCG